MKTPLRVLFVEDSENDKDLVIFELQRGGFNPRHQRVETEDELKNALQEDRWELIICDYSLPDFDGLSALKIVREQDIDVPFILISGAIGEDIAVKAMKAGAHDYILKGNLHRLVPAVERELKEAKIRKYHKKAEEEKNRLLKIVQQSLNEIYLFNSNTLRFEYVNQAALENLGYSLSEIKKKTPLDIISNMDSKPFKDLLHLKELLHPFTEGKKEKTVFFTNHIRKDGSTYPVETHLQVLKQSGDTFISAIVLDLTDREKDAILIKKQKKIAEGLALASKHKNRFLANMSHELRTPLNSINLLSKLLMDNRAGNLNEEQIEYLNVIHRSGNSLFALISDILDLSKIEAGEMAIHLEQVKISSICTFVEKMFKPVARNKGIYFSVDIQKDLNQTISTDRLRIEQVLKNFLSNAFKFTEKGQIELSVYSPGAEEERNLEIDANECIAFQVRDTGIGIPKNKHELIFEAFQQSDGFTKKKYGGTGLGLSICREITDLLGGKITLQSEPGVGSIFTLYLPVDRNKDLKKSGYEMRNRKEAVHEETVTYGVNNPAISQNNSQSNDCNSTQLLLVDDSEIHVSALKELLENNKKIKCFVAGSANKTLELLNSVKIDCLILDLTLPDASGFELIREIKETDDFKQIPMIVYTGRSLNREEKQQLETQVQAVVIKTCDNFKKLKNALNDILKTSDHAYFRTDRSR